MLKFDCNKIRNAREKSGMYQKDVAVRVGVKRDAVCDWEYGLLLYMYILISILMMSKFA